MLAAVLFDEPDGDVAAENLRGCDLFAPSLIDHEMVSVAAKKSLAGLEDVARQGLAGLARVQLTRCQTDVAAQYQLALAYNLSAYDAAYLWLAQHLQAPLATFDRRLAAAARQHLGAGP
ncbi:MAG: type II toxin-antitoxin system VapC family toxin [Gammaproteobacteria bacterium]|nr:type II toxin-antitoxin system VapC family toxin [Gammaproteobacteria bacterium]